MMVERVRVREGERERYLKRAGAWIAVALIHMVILAALLTAGKIAPPTPKAPPKEVLLLLPAIHPHTETNRPPAESLPLPAPPPEPSTAITLPPRPVPQSTHPPTDVMREIGKALSCGAGSFENLTQAQREACRRAPWHFKKDARGVIVLDTTAPPPEEPTSGADAELHIQQTADPCLAAGNTHSECIHKTLFGR